MSITIQTNVKTLDRLRKHIYQVQKRQNLRNDKMFKEYLKVLFMQEVLKQCENLPGGSVSQQYTKNNKIRDTIDGFVIYNDTTVATDSKGYDGEFSIALAFEYGTGLVGQENAKLGAWQYNVNGHLNGWYYFKNEEFHWTRGIEGYEIYRNAYINIRNNFNKWVDSYIERKG